MKIREWSQKILWFVFGALSIGSLLLIATAHGKRAATVSTLEERVSSLEQRVRAIEAREDARAKEEKNRNRTGGKVDQ